MAWTSSKSCSVDKVGWVQFCYSSDLQGCEEIRPAPATGLCTYIEHLFIHCVDALDVTIGEGENAGSVTTAYTTFEFVATSGSPIDIHFTRPIKVTAATSFTADASAAGKVTIIATGFTKK